MIQVFSGFSTCRQICRNGERSPHKALAELAENAENSRLRPPPVRQCVEIVQLPAQLA